MEMMKKVLLMVGALPGVLVADSIHHNTRSDGRVVVKFDEPVVPLSVVENCAYERGSEQDRGLNLFDITGDAQFTPTASWVDQDRLEIRYRKGFNGGTVYRLSFRPGSAKYLSGKEMPQPNFEFSYCGKPASYMDVMPGLPQDAVCLYVADPLTRAQLDFSPQSAVNYVFREVVDEHKPQHDSKRYGRTVKGVPEQALLRHMDPRYAFRLLFKDKKGDDKAQPALASLSLDTPIPGHVLVQPQEPLLGGAEWELLVDPDEGSDMTEMNAYVTRVQVPSLAVACSLGKVDKGAEPQVPAMLLQVDIGTPVQTSALAEIFRSIRLSVAGHAAVNSEDGKSKILILPGGKNLVFTLQEPENNDFSIELPQNGNREISYNPPITSGLSMRVSGTAVLPQVVDVTLPAGTRAMLGAESREDCTCRVSLTPAEPALEYSNFTTPLLLPAAQPHKLRLHGNSLSNLQVSAARLSPEQCLEYMDVLRQVDFSELNQIAELQYSLARSLTRRRISNVMVGVNEIKATERRLRYMIEKAPDTEALRRRLSGVSFSPVHTVAAESAGELGLCATDVEIDFDVLMGGQAKPGYYLVAVRRNPTAEVVQQLRAVGANPALYSAEQWFAVQITDLNLISGTDALVVTRLSDGSPVLQGQLLQQGKAPVEVQNAVAPVPPVVANRSTRERDGYWLVLQSGDDYRPVLWYENYPRMSTDSRLEIVRDRGTYRPGEVVRLRGVLRSVSPRGVAALPKGVSYVSITVRRPNGQVLQQKKVTVNPWGAFDYELTLPDGEEDVTGNYRILAESGDYRAYTYVPCRIFRRDSFELNAELNMQPIRPGEYSVTVSATDLNGTPLSGGKAKLETVLCIGGMQVANNDDEDSAGDKVPGIQRQSHELTLGADGTATLTVKLPELPDNAVGSSLSVSGEVTNDRQEVLRLPSIVRSIYPADFVAELTEGETLRLMAVNTEGYGNQVLNREQTVHLRLRGRLPRMNKLPNGVTITDTIPLTLWEGDITVPADSQFGVPTGLMQRWQKFVDSLSKSPEYARQPMQVEISAKDAAGRSIVQSLTNYPPRIHRPSAGATCRAQYENGALKVKATVPQGGQMVAVLRSVLGTRALPIQVLKEGENEITLQLLPGEFGQVNLCFMQPTKSDGSLYYDSLQRLVCNTTVPQTESALQVQLELPKQNPRPGERISLGGKVQGADGKPAAAQVTLFAVDEGMLSVDNHRVPNLQMEFNHVWVDSFSPRIQRLAQPQRPGKRLLDGLWRGERIGRDGAISPPLSRLFDIDIDMEDGDSAVYYKKVGGRMMKSRAVAAVPTNGAIADECAEPMAMESGAQSMGLGVDSSNRGYDTAPKPRLRTNFVPVAVWAPALTTDANGNFTTEFTLPDTFTTYKVFAIALGSNGSSFGNGEGRFSVNQPVMLTPGTPLFMSMGDVLRLPLTVTNATDSEGTWTVTLEGAAPQQVTLQAKSTATLYFDYTAATEGEHKLHWQAVAAGGSDAVEGSFNVRFPAPLLKEAHHLVLAEGQPVLKLGELPAPELANSTRSKAEVLLSANPLLHLYGCMELVHGTAYPCSHYGATAMLTWMLHERLAPFSPLMAETPAAEARRYVTRGIEELLKGQKEDGGISYWYGARDSSPWASAYAGLVLTLAQQHGFSVPADKFAALQDYLRKQLELSRRPEPQVTFSPFDLYAIGRTIGDTTTVTAALATALGREEQGSEQAAIYGSAFAHCWWRSGYAVASLRFLAEMDKGKTDIHGDFLRWMRAVGHDYRHATTWDGGWMLIALHEYLRHTPAVDATATLAMQDGRRFTIGQGMTTIHLAENLPPAKQPFTLQTVAGTTYLTVNFRALPEQTEYPGVTEKGLQITRIYEKKDADGVWREAREFNVGDVVRVTLTCAKGDRELNYFVLEDYLPSCMEAIDPAIRSQSAGLEWRPWSHWFDHREFLAYRVRGFCTRWSGRDLLNMSYYARVKRAGTSVAPPAQAQLLYEPQTYGLSENTIIVSK